MIHYNQYLISLFCQMLQDGGGGGHAQLGSMKTVNDAEKIEWREN